MREILCVTLGLVSISIVLFSIYIEYGSGMGGVLFRKGSSGNYAFTPLNVIRIMAWPFKEKNLWKPSSWDINYWVAWGPPALVLSWIFVHIHSHDTRLNS